jgi:hypothetical protein
MSNEPAWYYVGNGRLRLWNGKQWTESYRSADRPRAQAATRVVTPLAAPNEQREAAVGSRRGSRIVTWALVVAAAVLATVIGIAVLRGDVSHPEPTGHARPSATTR